MFEKILIIGVFVALTLTSSTTGVCPESNGAFKRLGDTRYYIIHENKRGDFVSFEKAKEDCHKHGLKMATIKNLMALRVAGRELERIVFEENLKDTWYWIDAKYNEKSKTYMSENKEELKYHVFYYRHPRPIGIGKHIDFNNKYQPESNKTQCLTLALPLPRNEEYKDDKAFYGHKTYFDERDCLSEKARHAICESSDKTCDKKETSPYKLHEGQGDYFYEGNWIYGDRTYITNFKPVTAKESEAYCESLGMYSVTASEADNYLTPHLKMWSRALTVTQFWTSMKYNTETRKFIDADGDEVDDKLTGAVNLTGDSTNWNIEGSETEDSIDKELCVAISISFELQDQLPCNPDSPNCKWSFYRYVPANCNNYHGSICQHWDHWGRKITWYPDYKNDLKQVLEKTALTSDFGYSGNRLVQRSKYKQTFGIFYCPDSYRPIRSDQNEFTAWTVKPDDETEFYEYDYRETYWVIDEDLYDKTENGKCTVSLIEKGYRKFKQVSCSEWHFYLCIKNGRRPQRKITREINEPPKMQWSPQEQPRLFPIFKESVNLIEDRILPNILATGGILTAIRSGILDRNPKVIKKTGEDQNPLIESIHNIDSIENFDKYLGKRENGEIQEFNKPKNKYNERNRYKAKNKRSGKNANFRGDLNNENSTNVMGRSMQPTKPRKSKKPMTEKGFEGAVTPTQERKNVNKSGYMQGRTFSEVNQEYLGNKSGANKNADHPQTATQTTDSESQYNPDIMQGRSLKKAPCKKKQNQTQGATKQSPQAGRNIGGDPQQMDNEQNEQDLQSNPNAGTKIIPNEMQGRSLKKPPCKKKQNQTEAANIAGPQSGRSLGNEPQDMENDQQDQVSQANPNSANQYNPDIMQGRSLKKAPCKKKQNQTQGATRQSPQAGRNIGGDPQQMDNEQIDQDLQSNPNAGTKIIPNEMQGRSLKKPPCKKKQNQTQAANIAGPQSGRSLGNEPQDMENDQQDQVSQTNPNSANQYNPDIMQGRSLKKAPCKKKQNQTQGATRQSPQAGRNIGGDPQQMDNEQIDQDLQSNPNAGTKIIPNEMQGRSLKKPPCKKKQNQTQAANIAGPQSGRSLGNEPQDMENDQQDQVSQTNPNSANQFNPDIMQGRSLKKAPCKKKQNQTQGATKQSPQAGRNIGGVPQQMDNEQNEQDLQSNPNAGTKIIPNEMQGRSLKKPPCKKKQNQTQAANIAGPQSGRSLGNEPQDMENDQQDQVSQTNPNSANQYNPDIMQGRSLEKAPCKKKQNQTQGATRQSPQAGRNIGGDPQQMDNEQIDQDLQSNPNAGTKIIPNEMQGRSLKKPPCKKKQNQTQAANIAGPQSGRSLGNEPQDMENDQQDQVSQTNPNSANQYNPDIMQGRSLKKAPCKKKQNQTQGATKQSPQAGRNIGGDPQQMDNEQIDQDLQSNPNAGTKIIPNEMQGRSLKKPPCKKKQNQTQAANIAGPQSGRSLGIEPQDMENDQQDQVSQTNPKSANQYNPDIMQGRSLKKAPCKKKQNQTQGATKQSPQAGRNIGGVPQQMDNEQNEQDLQSNPNAGTKIIPNEMQGRSLKKPPCKKKQNQTQAANIAGPQSGRSLGNEPQDMENDQQDQVSQTNPNSANQYNPDIMQGRSLKKAPCKKKQNQTQGATKQSPQAGRNIGGDPQQMDNEQIDQDLQSNPNAGTKIIPNEMQGRSLKKPPCKKKQNQTQAANIAGPQSGRSLGNEPQDMENDQQDQVSQTNPNSVNQYNSDIMQGRSLKKAPCKKKQNQTQGATKQSPQAGRNIGGDPQQMDNEQNEQDLQSNPNAETKIIPNEMQGRSLKKPPCKKKQNQTQAANIAGPQSGRSLGNEPQDMENDQQDQVSQTNPNSANQYNPDIMQGRSLKKAPCKKKQNQTQGATRQSPQAGRNIGGDPQQMDNEQIDQDLQSNPNAGTKIIPNEMQGRSLKKPPCKKKQNQTQAANIAGPQSGRSLGNEPQDMENDQQDQVSQTNPNSANQYNPDIMQGRSLKKAPCKKKQNQTQGATKQSPQAGRNIGGDPQQMDNEQIDQDLQSNPNAGTKIIPNEMQGRSLKKPPCKKKQNQTQAANIAGPQSGRSLGNEPQDMENDQQDQVSQTNPNSANQYNSDIMQGRSLKKAPCKKKQNQTQGATRQSPQAGRNIGGDPQQMDNEQIDQDLQSNPNAGTKIIPNEMQGRSLKKPPCKKKQNQTQALNIAGPQSGRSMSGDVETMNITKKTDSDISPHSGKPNSPSLIMNDVQGRSFRKPACKKNQTKISPGSNLQHGSQAGRSINGDAQFVSEETEANSEENVPVYNDNVSYSTSQNQQNDAGTANAQNIENNTRQYGSQNNRDNGRYSYSAHNQNNVNSSSSQFNRGYSNSPGFLNSQNHYNYDSGKTSNTPSSSNNKKHYDYNNGERSNSPSSSSNRKQYNYNNGKTFHSRLNGNKGQYSYSNIGNNRKDTNPHSSGYNGRIFNTPSDKNNKNSYSDFSDNSQVETDPNPEYDCGDDNDFSKKTSMQGRALSSKGCKNKRSSQKPEEDHHTLR